MLFKRKQIPFPIPDDARELTEEEMILVNGGGKEQGGQQESQGESSETQTVKKGDTLGQIVADYNKDHGTDLTVADVAKMSGIENPDLIYPGQKISFGMSNSTSSTPTSSNISNSNCSSGLSGTYTSSSASSSSASTTNTETVCTTNTIKDKKHHSAYDQQFINEMMEKEQTIALGGNGITVEKIEENIINSNCSSIAPKERTVTDRIAQAKKNEFLASLYEGDNAGYVIDHKNKIIKTNWSDKKALAQAKYMLQNYETLNDGYRLVAYDGKKDNFLTFKSYADVNTYQTFEKMGVYENNPNGSDVYFIYTYTETDKWMKEFERSSIMDDIKYLQKNGISVKVIESGTREDILNAFSDDKAKIIITSGHGSDDGCICTSDSSKVYSWDVQKLEVGDSLKTVIFENCYQGDFETSWEEAFKGTVDVVGWNGKTNIYETRFFNGNGWFDRQDLTLNDYLNLSLFGESSSDRNY